MTQGGRWEAKLFAQGQTFRNLTSQVTPSPTVRLGEVRDRIQVIPSNDFGGQGQWTLPVGPRHRLAVGFDARAIVGQSEEQIFTPSGGPIGRSLAELWVKVRCLHAGKVVSRQIFRAPSSFRRTLYQRPAKALGKFWWRHETAGQKKGMQRLAIRLAVW
jgi:hypothetical protein